MAAIVDLLSGGLLWKLGAMALAVVVFVWLARMQRDDESGIDFLQMLKDPHSKEIDPDRVGYAVVLVVTTIGFVYFTMTVIMTAAEFSLLMGTYAGIFVISKGANKALGRPQMPAVVVPPAATQINVAAAAKEGA